MPYSNVRGMLSKRLLEAQILLHSCNDSNMTNEAKRAIRGHLYVALSGVYERSLNDCVQIGLELANSHQIPVSSLKDGILLFSLRPDLESYRNSSSKKIWQRGLDLLGQTSSSEPADCNYVFPAHGRFMRPSQLQFIWRLFSLPGDPWPDPSLISRIHEIVEARNEIAHGEESAGQRGRHVSNDDMKSRIRDVEALCFHIITCFSDHLKQRADFAK